MLKKNTTIILTSIVSGLDYEKVEPFLPLLGRLLKFIEGRLDHWAQKVSDRAFARAGGPSSPLEKPQKIKGVISGSGSQLGVAIGPCRAKPDPGMACQGQDRARLGPPG